MISVKNLQRKLSKELTEVKDYVAKETVEFAIKKDIVGMARDRKQLINEAFTEMTRAYLEIIKVAKDQGITSIVLNNGYDIDDLDEEIKTMEGLVDHYNKKKFFNAKFRKGINIFPIQNTVEKWNILCHVIKTFPATMEYAKDHLSIDTWYYQDLYVKYSALEENLDILKKKIKKDISNKNDR